MTEKKKFDDHAHVLIVQKHQIRCTQAQLGRLDATLESMLSEQAGSQELIGQLLSQAQSIVSESPIAFEIDDKKVGLIEHELYVDSNEIAFTHQEIKTLDNIEVTDSTYWYQYLNQVEAYAASHDLEFGEDPFQNLMSSSQRRTLEKRIKEEFFFKKANCDQYDYMIAGTCGLIGGMIDVFFAGWLTKLTDDLTNTVIQKFATLNGWGGPREGKDPTNSAIGFFERHYKVNYDQRHGGDVDGRFNMSSKNHRIKSLAHSPDLVGLFFSILDQFTSTAHFVDDGKIISVDTETFDLKGSNLAAKLCAGFTNWLWHLFSDVGGSSGSKERGSGIPIPFYSLLQFIDVGEFGQYKQTFAKISIQVFEEGYDFRHGMALAIPVLVTEFLTRITWVVKNHFYHKKPWIGCIPSANNQEIRRMLLIAHGSLCLVDTVDATLRSGGTMIKFLLNTNLIAWVRFGTIALKELMAWHHEGDLDIEVVDSHLEAEYKRLLEQAS